MSAPISANQKPVPTKNVPLKNPVNDAKDISASLKRLNFDVLLATDADKRQMLKAINSFAKKLSTALPDRGNVAQTQELIHEMNQRIGEYLAVKTLVNFLLAAISYGVLWLFGVDFALFWALIIGLLNYIPYVGSLLGVAFPVLLSVAQFGSIQTTLWIAVLLTAVQMLVGNALEPRMIGQRVNLSPFVVLVSLAFWSALWGIAGAILAIPLTAVLSIGFGAIPATRPLAIMLANDVTIYEHDN